MDLYRSWRDTWCQTVPDVHAIRRIETIMNGSKHGGVADRCLDC